MVAKNKYDKYVIKDAIQNWKFVPRLRICGEELGGTEFSMFWDYITEPYHMIQEPHSHEFDQFLCFLGHNPMNIRDFHARIEFSMGEEKEVQIIDSATSIYIPKGLPHGPLNFIEVEKPVMFIECMLTANYRRNFVDQKDNVLKSRE